MEKKLKKCVCVCVCLSVGFPGGTVVKNLPANSGDSRDIGSIPGLGRSPGGNPLQESCLENSMNRGAWQATVHGVAKSQTQLSTHTRTYIHMYMYITEPHVHTEPPCCAPETNTTLLISYGSIKKKNFCTTVYLSHFQIILVLPNYPLD